MTVFAFFNSRPLTSSVSQLGRATALTSALVVATGLTGCSLFQKSPAVVNQPAPLTNLSNSQHVLSPVFSKNISGKSIASVSSPSLKSLNPFGKKQSKTLTQSPSAFRVAMDDQGYIAAGADGMVLATNTRGDKLWEAKFKQGLSGGVALDAASGTVIISDSNGKLIALDRITGQQRWQTQLTSNVLAPALITNNRIITIGNNGIISTNSLQTGDAIWQFATQNPNLSVRGSTSPILLDNNTLLAATADGRVHALNLDNGVPLWSRRMSNAQGGSEVERLSDIDATPVLRGNMLYVVTYSNQLIAVDMSSRQLAFLKDYASIKSVGVDDSQIYVTTLDGNVAALDRLTGNVNWESDALHYRGLSNALPVGNYVLVGDALGYLHVLDKTSGNVVDRLSARGGDISQLTLNGNQVISQSTNGNFSVWQVTR